MSLVLKRVILFWLISCLKDWWFGWFLRQLDSKDFNWSSNLLVLLPILWEKIMPRLEFFIRKGSSLFRAMLQ